MVSIAADRERSTAEAGAWLARLQGADVSADDGVAFEAWLAETPGNSDAYREALSVWHAYDAAAAEVLAELDAPPARTVRPQATRRWWVGAGGFAIAAGLAVAILPPMLTQTATDVYQTGRGQHRSVSLADGSTVHLNAETKLAVRLERGERRVVLEEGEAIFQVAHDKARPFTVAAADHVVRVVGTQFDVRSRDGQLHVTVAEGKVQVSPRKAAGAAPVLLIRGQKLAVQADGATELSAVDPQEAFSWRAGRLVYRDTPLSVVVADLNRQFEQQIEIGDPELGAIPITGVIVLDDPGAVTQRLSLMLPVRSVPSERGLRLLKK
ncbi:FecR domain-containing protein [Phenylobacterium sp. J367]|uniref:FecR family protein n=1 Tax=Phenylobacterium sp. J367 TaxID=2898435 RepID=UPI002150B3B5|nr:FecR domain-containing protein [Phenylobacterium sp. J367]MCR5880921.1 FecR domain-containing protein [Phenylobacterium sp. J367]